MFNSCRNNTNLKINAVSGTLVKNYRKSFFIYRGKDAYIFNEEMPRLYGRERKSEEVVVLQTIIVGEDRFLCEVMYKSDFDELFEKEEQGDE